MSPPFNTYALLRHAALASRIIAAILGGYVLAALFSVAALALPLPRSEAWLTGMLGSFLIYAMAVIWVFAVRSAWRAWAGLLIGAAALLPWAWIQFQRVAAT